MKIDVLLYLEKKSLFLLFLLLLSSCSDDRKATSDLYPISYDLRLRIDQNIAEIPLSQKDLFYFYLNQLESTCSKYNDKSAEYYMETEEYEQFKSFIIEYNPYSYYLLIDIFLKGETNLGVFNYMFHDLIESSYTGLIEKVMEALDKTSTDVFLKRYPEVCIEYLLSAIE